MTVATPVLPNFTTQAPSTYKATLDGAALASSRAGFAFAPHEQATPDMTVRIDAGFLLNPRGSFAGVSAQTVSGFTAPASQSRIDRVVLAPSTGVASRVAGTEGSGSPPALPTGRLPLAQIVLQPGTTAITNSMIADERAFGFTYPGRRGAMLKRTADQSIPNNTLTLVSWQAAEYDDFALWSGGDPTKITIPSGVSKIRFMLNVKLEFVVGIVDAHPVKNGNGPIQMGCGGVSLEVSNTSGDVTILGFASGILDVAAGDTWEFQVRHRTGAAKNLKATNETFLMVEVIE